MDWLANVLGDILAVTLGMFAGINLSPVVQAIEVISPFIKVILFILPVGAIKDIFACTVVVWGIRLVIKTIRTIWDLLPWL